MPNDSVADRLLDAQVSWLIGQLTGPGLPDVVAQDVDNLLAAGARVKLGELADATDIKRVARLLFTEVPAGTAASTLVEMTADVLWKGPTESFALSDVIDREHVEALIDEALGLTEFAEAFLEGLAKSPLVATLSARFVGRIVNDVVQANRAVAEKIPGLGSLVSFGAGAAGKVTGAANKQFEQLLGDTAGKGAAFAMKRLNKVVIETLKDPTAREAALQVFDLYADETLPPLKALGSKEDLRRVAGLIQDIVIAGASTEPVLGFVDALIDGFFNAYGGDPVATLIDDLALTRDDLVAHGTAIVTRALESDDVRRELEALLRARLGSFFASPEVAAILEG